MDSSSSTNNPNYFEKASEFSDYLLLLASQLTESGVGEITFIANTTNDLKNFRRKISLIKAIENQDSVEYKTLKREYLAKKGPSYSEDNYSNDAFEEDVNQDIDTLDIGFKKAQEEGKNGVANIICGVQITKTYDTNEDIIKKIRAKAIELGLEIDIESIVELDDDVPSDFWFYIINVATGDNIVTN